MPNGHREVAMNMHSVATAIKTKGIIEPSGISVPPAATSGSPRPGNPETDTLAASMRPLVGEMQTALDKPFADVRLPIGQQALPEIAPVPETATLGKAQRLSGDLSSRTLETGNIRSGQNEPNSNKGMLASLKDIFGKAFRTGSPVSATAYTATPGTELSGTLPLPPTGTDALPLPVPHKRIAGPSSFADHLLKRAAGMLKPAGVPLHSSSSGELSNAASTLLSGMPTAQRETLRGLPEGAAINHMLARDAGKVPIGGVFAGLAGGAEDAPGYETAGMPNSSGALGAAGSRKTAARPESGDTLGSVLRSLIEGISEYEKVLPEIFTEENVRGFADVAETARDIRNGRASGASSAPFESADMRRSVTEKNIGNRNDVTVSMTPSATESILTFKTPNCSSSAYPYGANIT